MITHEFKNGDTEIRVESAESLEDAKKNNFPDGMYSRFFVNGKPVNNYMSMVQYIVSETQRTGKRFIPPTSEKLREMQKNALKRQNDEIREQYVKLKNDYKKSGAPEIVLKQLDEAISKIDVAGVRVFE